MLDDGRLPATTARCKATLPAVAFGCWQVDTISFGQAIPVAALQSAVADAHDADLVIVMGTGLAVAPANQLPAIAITNGVPLVRGGVDWHIALCKWASLFGNADGVNILGVFGAFWVSWGLCVFVCESVCVCVVYVCVRATTC